jgi:hypothetical protein
MAADQGLPLLQRYKALGRHQRCGINQARVHTPAITAQAPHTGIEAVAFGRPAQQPPRQAPSPCRSWDVETRPSSAANLRRRRLTEGWLMFNSGAARTVLPLNSIRSNTRTSLSALGVRYGAMTAASASCSVSAAETVRAVFRAKKRKMGSANASPDD